MKKKVTKMRSKNAEFPLTMEALALEKLELKRRIRRSEKRMREATDVLFTPQPTTSNADMFFQVAKKGFALYDGVMMGYKVAKMIRTMLKVRKK